MSDSLHLQKHEDMLEAAAKLRDQAARLREHGDTYATAASGVQGSIFTGWGMEGFASTMRVKTSLDSTATQMEEHAAAIEKTVAVGKSAAAQGTQGVASVPAPPPIA